MLFYFNPTKIGRAATSIYYLDNVALRVGINDTNEKTLSEHPSFKDLIACGAVTLVDDKIDVALYTSPPAVTKPPKTRSTPNKEAKENDNSHL